MLINSPNISGSLTVTGNSVITGSLTVLGGINATITGSATSASYVEYSNVANKPTLVSGSAQVAAFGFATTGSNQFNGSQAITGSLTVTGQVIAQTLNVQQVTSSIVYSSGSNIFGNSLSNTQQLTGSVSVTGSLTVNNTPAILGSLTSGQVAFGTAANTIGGDNGLFWDNTNKYLGIGTNSPATALDVKSFVRIDTYDAGITVPHTAGFLRILSGNKTGWAPNDELGKIEFFGTDTSGIGPRNLASIRAVNSQGNGTTTGSSNGELYFYTSIVNALETEKWRIRDTGVLQSNGAQTIQTSTGNLTLTSADNTGIVDIRRNDRALGAELRITNSFNGSGWLAGDVVGTLNFVSADGSTTEPIRSQIKAINTGGSNTYASEMNLTFSTAFFNTLTEGFRLTNLSNLLVGTTTDAGFRLDVNGTARVQGNLTVGQTSYLAGTYSLDVTTGGIAGISEVARFAANGNGGTNRGAGIVISAPGSASTVSVARLVGYQETASATANNASFAIQVANSSGTLTEYLRINNVGGVGIGATTINASARLQVDSTTQGFLPPRMTSTQRDAIASPATGLVVYQTDGVEGLYVRTSTAWRALAMV
jgi:hypothetical protein